MAVGTSSKISKILLSILFLLVLFYIFMDIELYLRIHNYYIEKNYHINTTADKLPPIIQENNEKAEESYTKYTWIPCHINPLCYVTVKAVLLDHTNHYLFAPLATIVDDVGGFSKSSFISANMISIFHVGVAIVSAKLIACDSLNYRRVGVVLFEFRTFLDDLDGHVARVKKNIRGERSEIGTSGYYVDGICDALGCIALLIGLAFYFKNNPPRRGYTQLPMKLMKLPDPVYRHKKKSVHKVAKKIMSFTGQLVLSSSAWNRYIAVYQDLLERTDVTTEQSLHQNIVFKSTWFFCIAWIWRIVNVHSLLHCILLAIFFDKLWEFLKFMQYNGFVILLLAICVSEMHILEAHNCIYNIMLKNNSSV